MDCVYRILNSETRRANINHHLENLQKNNQSTVDLTAIKTNTLREKDQLIRLLTFIKLVVIC